MLSQRKRYNYMVASHQRRNNNENYYPPQEPDSKRVKQLESENKRLIEDTTKQFQKFEMDLLKVEDIIQGKQSEISTLKRQNAKSNEQMSMLIDALHEKEIIIKQLQSKFRQISTSTPSQPAQSQTSPYVSDAYTQTQTEDQKQEYRQKYEEIIDKAVKLEDQVYKLKEELFATSSELNLVRQQFSTYKLLKQIEDVQNE